MKELSQYAYKLLIKNGISEELSQYLNVVIGVLVLFIVLYILDIIIKRVLLNLFKKYASKSKNVLDDFFVKNKTFDYLSHIIPLSISIWVLPTLFAAFPVTESYLKVIFDILIIALIIWIVRSILRTFRDFLKSLESFKDKPIDSYVQVFMIIVWTM